MTEYVCKRCGSNKIELKKQGIHEGVYCKDCGCWIKWVKKDAEKNDFALKKQLSMSNSSSDSMKQETSILNNISNVPESEISSVSNEPENDFPFVPDEPAKIMTLLVHGPVELEFSDGRRVWLSDNSRVEIEKTKIKEYKIATNELIREITYY